MNGTARERSRSRDRHHTSKGSLAIDGMAYCSHGVDYQSSRNDRRRSRSRSPRRNGAGTHIRTRSPPRGPRTDHDRSRGRDRDKIKQEPTDEKKPVQPESDVKVKGSAMEVDEDDEEALLRKMMGFTTFKTTQNTKVPGNQIYGVRKEKKTQYRQYMNRVGGFNRPLSPSR